MSVYLYFNTSSLGSVQAYININNNSIDFNIYTEDSENLESIKAFETELNSLLNQTKYSVNGIVYGYFEGESPINEGASDEETTQTTVNSHSLFEVSI
jgi:hypothetical protein